MTKHTEDMPKDVKTVWSIGIGVIGACGIIFIGFPAVILLIAFPESLFVIVLLAILLIGGYIKGKKT